MPLFSNPKPHMHTSYPLTPATPEPRDLKPANLMIGGSHVDTDMHRRLLLHELGTVKIADFGLSKSLKLNKGGDPGDTPEGSRQGGSTAAAAAASGEDDSAQPRHEQKMKQAHSYKLTGETGSYRCGEYLVVVCMLCF